MKFIDEFRSADLSRSLTDYIKRISKKKITLMEFCGGHTVAIMRHGIRQLLPQNIKLISGPGCPVCVTANSDMDKAIAFARLPDVIITSFGDMLKVPGSYSSLQQARAEGADIRIVYSVQDALNLAVKNPSRKVIFLGIGFETTAPTIASAIIEAKRGNINNFFVFSLLKLCPPSMKAILDLGEVKIDGIIGPGHVSAIIGTSQYEFIPRDYGIAFSISGFEPADILQCIVVLVRQIENGQPKVENAYKRGVKPDGNQVALKQIENVFEICDAEWRGFGIIPRSGLKISEEFADYDASLNFKIETPQPKEHKGCLCGEILRGVREPGSCTLFRKVCTPENPIGPCMVSSEGACSAYYLYGE